MPGFSSKPRGQVAAGLLVVSIAVIAILAAAQTAHSTDLTTPSFLVATRDLQDPLFQQAVVLMIPSAEPPLLAGVIINSPAKVPVRALFPQARQLERTQETVYFGGPVEPGKPSVIFRASSPPRSATRILDDTYVATGRDAVAAVLQDPRIHDLRVILGKAQWLRDQLYGEIMRGAWYVVPAKPDLVFADPKDLWSILVQGGDLQEVRGWRASGASVANAGEQAAAAVFTIESKLPAGNLPQGRFDGTN
jgi:putative transcriptional regulator